MRELQQPVLPERRSGRSVAVVGATGAVGREMLAVLEQRWAKLEPKQRAFYEAHLGSVRRVVWEHSERDGRMLGYTDNYIRVEAEFDAALAGTRAWVRLTELTPRETVATEPAADPAQTAAV